MTKSATWFNRLLCRLFGHRVKLHYVYRTRRDKPWWNNFSKSGGAKKCHTSKVLGGYEICARCGKKLSNFQRLK